MRAAAKASREGAGSNIQSYTTSESGPWDEVEQGVQLIDMLRNEVARILQCNNCEF